MKQSRMVKCHIKYTEESLGTVYFTIEIFQMKRNIYDDNLPDDVQPKLEIEFVYDNPCGIQFVELFDKSLFSKTKVRAFILDQIRAARIIEEVKSKITPQLVNELIHNHFRNKYDISEVSKAVESVNIMVTSKIMYTEQSRRQTYSPPPGIRNNSRKTVVNESIPEGNITSGLKIGKIAQSLLHKTLESGKISDDEIRLLQNKEFSKMNFGIDFPLLVIEDSNYEKRRYYNNSVFINGIRYRMCSQWFETLANNDRPYLLAWLQERGVIH